MKPKHIMIIAGEASGDLHGSKLVRAICNKNNKIYFSGIGGQTLRDAGVEILVDASELSVVGITEVFSKIPNLFKAIANVKRHLKSIKPLTLKLQQPLKSSIYLFYIISVLRFGRGDRAASK